MFAEIKLLDPRASVPQRGTEGAAGYDVYCLLDEPKSLYAGEFETFRTGIAMSVPKGYFYQVCCRSGMAFNHKVFVPHAPGIIDSDYRGELKILLQNASDTMFTVFPGDRIAQLVFMKHECPAFLPVPELGETQRGSGGFGSTGGTGVVLG